MGVLQICDKCNKTFEVNYWEKHVCEPQKIVSPLDVILRGFLMKKRYRTPRANAGQLKAQWGKLPHDQPDLCVAWGEGCERADSRLLMNALTGKTFKPGSYDTYPGLTEELEKRGYDITTLKFSIQKKQ